MGRCGEGDEDGRRWEIEGVGNGKETEAASAQIGVVRLVRDVMSAGVKYEEVDPQHEALRAMIDLLKVLPESLVRDLCEDHMHNIPCTNTYWPHSQVELVCQCENQGQLCDTDASSDFMTCCTNRDTSWLHSRTAEAGRYDRKALISCHVVISLISPCRVTSESTSGASTID